MMNRRVTVAMQETTDGTDEDTDVDDEKNRLNEPASTTAPSNTRSARKRKLTLFTALTGTRRNDRSALNDHRT